MAAEQPTHQPERVIAGHCPECEVWPLVECACDWRGATTDIAQHTRLERMWT